MALTDHAASDSTDASSMVLIRGQVDSEDGIS
jgi:hypothetical protein